MKTLKTIVFAATLFLTLILTACSDPYYESIDESIDENEKLETEPRGDEGQVIRRD
ncbi:hypothetical protein JMN32_03420 [Fulvivirga sp. 29W222]|uniref:Secreted protein n=1 Tax=Fulvivirga marina TaxID=2494733 RepID=A0A937FUT9_9BACT|nr:hypothetical protein [Fulvivirga marina]MBL6445342.1 hypothetical protein [Fulvivirga marina]